MVMHLSCSIGIPRRTVVVQLVVPRLRFWDILGSKPATNYLTEFFPHFPPVTPVAMGP